MLSPPVFLVASINYSQVYFFTFLLANILPRRGFWVEGWLSYVDPLSVSFGAEFPGPIHLTVFAESSSFPFNFLVYPLFSPTLWKRICKNSAFKGIFSKFISGGLPEKFFPRLFFGFALFYNPRFTSAETDIFRFNLFPPAGRSRSWAEEIREVKPTGPFPADPKIMAVQRFPCGPNSPGKTDNKPADIPELEGFGTSPSGEGGYPRRIFKSQFWGPRLP